MTFHWDVDFLKGEKFIFKLKVGSRWMIKYENDEYENWAMKNV